MFINSKKTYEFPHPDEPKKVCTIPAEYLGPVDDWVTKTLLFQMAVKEGSITMVGHEKTIPAASGVSDEERELRKKGRALKIEGAAKLPLVELALAVHAAENPGTSEPEASEDSGKDKSSK